MEIISHYDKEKWNRIVKSFADWDIYYLCEYAVSLMINGDGKPYLIYYKDDNSRLCYVVMINDIADLPVFSNRLTEGKYFDMTTPYGYGGPIVEGDFNEISKAGFMNELEEHCKNNNIITQFFRFHPLFQNQSFVKDICEIASSKETINIDTSSTDIIIKNMDSKNRNMVRKAQKLGVKIIQDNGERLDDFIRIYESTMDKNSAETYYYFERQYYDYLKTDMRDNVIFFYSCIEEKIIAASIFFYNNKYMHYHLSGSLQEYRQLAATNLLLYEAALWACQREIKYLHLGGGVSAIDSLFGFKKQFNKSGHMPFYIGRNIFDRKIYNQLLQKRKEIDYTFNMENSYFIQYRR